MYYHNVATAVGALMICDDKLLLVERAKNPGKGLLGVPGGFVDPFESAEQALCREIDEEVGVKVDIHQLQYFGSWANEYLYAEINYHTQDFYYVVELASKPQLTLQQSEVSGVKWLSKHELELNQLAFCSARDALAKWKSS
ncbi:NUDIX hydrolase [Neptunicella marina]